MEQRLSNVGVHHNKLIKMGLLGLQLVAPLIQTLWGASTGQSDAGVGELLLG